MYKNQRVIVVMPAYNAAKTLTMTYDEVIQQGIVDHVIVVDDASADDTVAIARGLPNTTVITHEKNRGYGGNQKTCYRHALDAGADIVVMVHPDYQYTPQLIPAMSSLIGNGLYDCVIASRILGGQALDCGMPYWKYVCNRFLTLFTNSMTGAKLSEYHSGYRAFSRRLLEQLPLEKNSDDFVFDHEMLLQVVWAGHTIAEITCPTKYFEDASSINFQRSLVYGLGCVSSDVHFRFAKMGMVSSDRFHRPRK